MSKKGSKTSHKNIGRGATAGVQRNITTTRCCWRLSCRGVDLLPLLGGGRVKEREGMRAMSAKTAGWLRAVQGWLGPLGSGDEGEIARWCQQEQRQHQRWATVVVFEWSCCSLPPTATTWSRGKEQGGPISTIVVIIIIIISKVKRYL
jgi:hypothetical protein